MHLSLVGVINNVNGLKRDNGGTDGEIVRSDAKGNKALVVFQGRSIRRILFDDVWCFSEVDVAGILTDSPDPGNYWKVLNIGLWKREVMKRLQIVTD